MADLTDTENEYGFTFGNPNDERGDGTPTHTVSCVNPACKHQGIVQVYDDTPLPLHCGGCHTILVDDPNRSDVSLIPATVDDLDVLAEKLAGRMDLDAIAARIAARQTPPTA